MNLYDYAKKNKLTVQSAIKEKEFRDFFKNVRIKTVVEIGTHKGISACYMAQFAKKIFTFDVKDYRVKYKVWEDFGVKDRIFYFTVKDRDDVEEVLDSIKFDFSFIDGKHTYEDVKADFEMVKHCGKVLLHDVNKKKFTGVKKFAEEIGAKFLGNIAYWTG